MKQQYSGTYYFPASSKAELAEVHCTDNVIQLFFQNECISTTQVALLSISSAIPGVSQEITFEDGGKFVASSAQQRFAFGRGKSLAESLEKNIRVIIASLLLAPILVWFSLTVLLPALAAQSVKYLPDKVAQSMGDQSFYVIKKSFLEETELNQKLRDDTYKQWLLTLKTLGLSAEKYQLHFYKSDYFGANAFALPNGVVVITDDLLLQLKGKPDAVLAILLHEIGHIEHQHSLRLVAQSVSNTVAIAVIFGDLEAFGETLIGTGSALLQNAFSRDMEREADNFALRSLTRLGKSPMAFANAMQSFLQMQDEKAPIGKTSLLDYLSTHPDINERMAMAKEYKKSSSDE
jgi:Zn-dependent protease with chaperone function